MNSDHFPKVGIHDGVDGLIAGEVRDIAWADVDGWIGQVGPSGSDSDSDPVVNKLARITEML